MLPRHGIFYEAVLIIHPGHCKRSTVLAAVEAVPVTAISTLVNSVTAFQLTSTLNSDSISKMIDLVPHRLITVKSNAISKQMNK